MESKVLTLAGYSIEEIEALADEVPTSRERCSEMMSIISTIHNAYLALGSDEERAPFVEAVSMAVNYAIGFLGREY